MKRPLAMVLAAAATFFLTAASHDPDLNPPYGSVLHTSFNCGDAYDSSPYHHTPTLAGNAVITAGNRWVTLDGTGDYMHVGDAPEHSFTNGSGTDQAFSLSGWVKFDAIGTSYRNLVAKGSGKEWEFRPVNGSDSGIFVLYSGGAGSTYIARIWVDAPATGVWIHYAAVYSGGETVGSLAVYKNAVRVDSINATAGSYVGMSDTTATVRAGENIDGDIDGLDIINRALTLSEIQQLYSAGPP